MLTQSHITVTHQLLVKTGGSGTAADVAPTKFTQACTQCTSELHAVGRLFSKQDIICQLLTANKELQAVLAASGFVGCDSLGQTKGLGHSCCLNPGIALARLLALQLQNWMRHSRWQI